MRVVGSRMLLQAESLYLTRFSRFTSCWKGGSHKLLNIFHWFPKKMFLTQTADLAIFASNLMLTFEFHCITDFINRNPNYTEQTVQARLGWVRGGWSSGLNSFCQVTEVKLSRVRSNSG